MKTSTNQRWWDFPGALLLLVAMYLAALRLSATNWTEELQIIQLVVFFGTLAGLGLGQSIFGKRLVAGFALSYGAFVIAWQLGLSFGNGVLWNERLLGIGGRLAVSVGKVIRKESVTDPILFLTVMGLLFWILSSYAGYTLTRYGNPWRATLPTGVALFIIHIHDPFWPVRSWFLAGYIFLALLILSRMTFLHQRNFWQRSQTHTPPYLGLDFLRAALTVSSILILLAWTVPVMASSVPPVTRAYNQIAQPWYRFRDRISNAFSSLRASGMFVNDYYGANLSLGRGNVLNNNVILVVEAPPRPATGVRYYWRARVYDTYGEGQWSSIFPESTSLTPDDFNLNFPEQEGRWEATFKFHPGANFSTLYTVPQPQWVSRPVEVELSTNPDGTVDIAALQAKPAIREGEVYEVKSSLTNVTIAELRASSTDYPDWVTERYLQVPPSITPRTLELARQITLGLENPYDIAAAITNYLRENITYADTVPTPPADQDQIDWLLFDLRQGFCNYYATAEIVMLRSLGVPARLAVGYAQGQRDLENDTYIVRQRDAHAWPEVFFPGIGWVEFEPTVNQSALLRPLGDENPVDESGAGSNSRNQNPEAANRRQALLQGEREPLPESAGGVITGNQGTFWKQALTFGAGLALLFMATFAWQSHQRRLGKFIPLSVMIEAGLQKVGWKSKLLRRWAQMAQKREKNRKPRLPLLAHFERRLSEFGFHSPKFIKKWAYYSTLPEQARAYRQINRSLRWLRIPLPAGATPAERGSTLEDQIPAATDAISSVIADYQSTIYGQRTSDPFPAYQAARKIRYATWRKIGARLLARFQEPSRQISATRR